MKKQLAIFFILAAASLCESLGCPGYATADLQASTNLDQRVPELGSPRFESLRGGICLAQLPPRRW
jgi:hypothetical protein